MATATPPQTAKRTFAVVSDRWHCQPRPLHHQRVDFGCHWQSLWAASAEGRSTANHTGEPKPSPVAPRAGRMAADYGIIANHSRTHGRFIQRDGGQ